MTLVKATEQAIVKKRKVTNPKGKGGFKDHPELINAGGRPKNSQRYDYWLQFFKDMDVAKFRAYAKSKPESKMFVAEIQAYSRIAESLKDVKTWQIVADRTEGRASQSVAVTGAEGAPLFPIALDASILNRMTVSATATPSPKANSSK